MNKNYFSDFLFYKSQLFEIRFVLTFLNETNYESKILNNFDK